MGQSRHHTGVSGDDKLAKVMAGGNPLFTQYEGMAFHELRAVDQYAVEQEFDRLAVEEQAHPTRKVLGPVSPTDTVADDEEEDLADDELDEADAAYADGEDDEE